MSQIFLFICLVARVISAGSTYVSTAYIDVFETEDGVGVSSNDPGIKWIEVLMNIQGLNHTVESVCSPSQSVNETGVMLATIQMKAALNGICAWRRDKQTNRIIVKRSTGIPLYMHAMYNIERGVYVSLIFVLIAVLILRDIVSSDPYNVKDKKS